MNSERGFLVGATASDPRNAVTIWNAIRAWFVDRDFPLDYALYSTYDALCGALLRGEVDVAWNAPMAHAQSVLVSGGACRTLAMRDTDDSVATVIIARADAGIATPEDLRGRRLALGVPISTELRLVPVAGLGRLGIDVEHDVELVDLAPRPYSNGVAWIDDFQIFDAVRSGEADAGAIFEPWLAHLYRKRSVSPDDLPVIWRSEPFCHCAFTARPELPTSDGDRFVALLLDMNTSDDPRIAEMMQLEHLKEWRPATEAGWSDLMDAIRNAGLVGRTFV